VKHTSIRTLLALVALFDLELEQMDVKMAFVKHTVCCLFDYLQSVSSIYVSILRMNKISGWDECKCNIS
jgi:hypothetical protein